MPSSNSTSQGSKNGKQHSAPQADGSSKNDTKNSKRGPALTEKAPRDHIPADEVTGTSDKSMTPGIHR